jgi:predicted nuclease of predicted toxin-antitoxin system
MRVLLDENLSYKLTHRLIDLFPCIIHVRQIGLQSANDDQIWQRAKQYDLLITTDRDFIELIARDGPPPKVVRVERCDVKLAELEAMFRHEALRIYTFFRSDRHLLLLNPHTVNRRRRS